MAYSSDRAVRHPIFRPRRESGFFSPVVGRIVRLEPTCGRARRQSSKGWGGERRRLMKALALASGSRRPPVSGSGGAADGRGRETVRLRPPSIVIALLSLPRAARERKLLLLLLRSYVYTIGARNDGTPHRATQYHYNNNIVYGTRYATATAAEAEAAPADRDSVQPTDRVDLGRRRRHRRNRSRRRLPPNVMLSQHTARRPSSSP
jgi:hypothetical protein